MAAMAENQKVASIYQIVWSSALLPLWFYSNYVSYVPDTRP